MTASGPSSSSKGKGRAESDGNETFTEEERLAKEARQRSFERSLAGPSVGKAGLVRDQTEINRVIAEASKGSKFYTNQVRKDEVLTKKIAWFQAKRDSLMKDAQLDRLQAEADRILMEVEATRDMSQSIVHVDMDAFYASVETKRDPSLKGKAFGVGGGVLTTASYEARTYGVRSGMAEFVARKLCPHLIVVSNNFDLYIDASKSVREVLMQYDENLMMASLDEGYLNITAYMSSHNMTAAQVVTQLRAEVEAKTELTISAGIAPNKMLAKICSDKNKPNGQFELAFDRTVITRFMRDLPVRRIPGFGRVTERCLEGLGVETCGDIYEKRCELLTMDHWFGFRGLWTFRDKTNDQDIMDTLADIAVELGKDLERLQYSGKTVTVKYKLHTFENKTRAHSVKKYISSTDEILPIAQELLRKELPLRIRLLGIRLSTLKDLTVPERGIKAFLASPSKKHSGSEPVAGPLRSDTPGAHDIVNLADLDDDIEWTDENDFRPPDEDDPPSLKRKAQTLDEKHLLGPVCPICSKALGPSTSNQGLNEHIDSCLNKDAIQEAAKRSPKKSKRDVGDKPGGIREKGKGQAKKGSMMAWLNRSG